MSLKKMSRGTHHVFLGKKPWKSQYVLYCPTVKVNGLSLSVDARKLCIGSWLALSVVVPTAHVHVVRYWGWCLRVQKWSHSHGTIWCATAGGSVSSRILETEDCFFSHMRSHVPKDSPVVESSFDHTSMCHLCESETPGPLASRASSCT